MTTIDYSDVIADLQASVNKKKTAVTAKRWEKQANVVIDQKDKQISQLSKRNDEMTLVVASQNQQIKKEQTLNQQLDVQLKAMELKFEKLTMDQMNRKEDRSSEHLITELKTLQVKNRQLSDYARKLNEDRQKLRFKLSQNIHRSKSVQSTVLYQKMAVIKLKMTKIMEVIRS